MNSLFETVVKGATLDASGQYRYQLWRIWDESKPRVLFVMLNPSTADADNDDATIRKCIKFARLWGYGSLEVVNLFARRSTNPAALKGHADPKGQDNDTYLLESARRAEKIIAAWGSDKAIGQRDKQIETLLHDFDLYCLRLSEKGKPWHPLYIPDATMPIVYRAVVSVAA